MDQGLYEFHLNNLQNSTERITPGRKIILKTLCQTQEHLTSSEILEKVQETDAGVSRASVFRTLDLFQKLSIVHTTSSISGTTRYILTHPGGHHAHLICPECHETLELKECFLEGIEDQLQRAHGRQITGHLLEFYGVCPECSQRTLSGDVEG